jgi:type VI secretion system protein
MALRLQIVSRHRQSLGERGIKEFGQNGGTIGRSLESDWVLPDGQRFLSSRHASIDYRSGSYYIIDTSTNGVYINGSDQPVGRGKPQRLFSGDRVRIGDYDIQVEIDEIDSTREQMAGVGHVDPVDARQRVEAPDPTSYDLIDAFEITGVGIEMMLNEDEADTLVPLNYKFKTEDVEEIVLEGDDPRPQRKAKAKSKSKPSQKIVRSARKGSAGQSMSVSTGANPSPGTSKAAPAASRSTASGSGASRAASGARSSASPSAGPSSPPVASHPRTAAPASLDAFFRGAGMNARSLDERETDEILHRVGQLMRELVVGLTENLHTRTAQKSALRQPNTTIQPRDNNSLKFSAGVEEAFESLFFRHAEQYLDAVDAVREAFGDIKRHQQILFKAMQKAMGDYIGRLDPDALEEKFSNGRHGMLRGAANKLKYWDLYKDLYQVVAQQSPGELPQLFLEELAQAYEAEANRVAGHPRQRRKAS